MKVKSESEVAQSHPTLSDPVDYSLPGSSIHGIFQARVLEWGAIAFSSRGHSRVQRPEVERVCAWHVWTSAHAWRQRASPLAGSSEHVHGGTGRWASG